MKGPIFLSCDIFYLVAISYNESFAHIMRQTLNIILWRLFFIGANVERYFLNRGIENIFLTKN